MGSPDNLPPATGWRVLDTHFGTGAHFLSTWLSWHKNPARPTFLHYVALLDKPLAHCPVQPLSHTATASALTTTWVKELETHWWGLLPGVHRLRLAGGHVLLTLLITGEAGIPTMHNNGGKDSSPSAQTAASDQCRSTWHHAALVLLRNQTTPVDMIYWHGRLRTPNSSQDHGDDSTTPLTHQLNTLKALARYCRHGTRLISLAPPDAHSIAPPQEASLRHQCGFVDTDTTDAISPDEGPWQSTAKNGALAAAHHSVFSPHWIPEHNGTLTASTNIPSRRCIVIGAGISGAAAAHALATRGWQVTVVDKAAQPAQGASGLPAGLTAPHVSPDDNILSRLTRSGLRCTLHYAQHHLVAGSDWAPTGVLEHCVDGKLGLPSDWHNGKTATISRDWSHAATAQQLQQAHLPFGSAALWHPRAAWLRPASLARQLLQHPGITWLGGCAVDQIVRAENPSTPSITSDPPENQGHQHTTPPHTTPPAHAAPTWPQWKVIDSRGEVIAQAPLVIIAAGWDSTAWLPQGVRLNPLRGQVSWGWHMPTDGSVKPPSAATHQQPSTPWPPFPVNGKGSVIGHIPLPITNAPSQGGASLQTHAWFIGATFERATAILPPSTDEQRAAHATNQAKLQQLLPSLAEHLEPLFANTSNAAEENGEAVKNVNSWAGVRCTSHDRLPMVGAIAPAQPGLWVCTAMGARGLTLATLCAELLAARLHQEPLPIEASLAHVLDAARWA